MVVVGVVVVVGGRVVVVGALMVVLGPLESPPQTSTPLKSMEVTFGALAELKKHKELENYVASNP